MTNFYRSNRPYLIYSHTKSTRTEPSAFCISERHIKICTLKGSRNSIAIGISVHRYAAHPEKERPSSVFETSGTPFPTELLAQEGRTDDTGIITQLAKTNFCLLVVMFGIALRLDNLHERLKQRIPLTADTAADAEDIRLENIDDIHQTAAQIGNILIYNGLTYLTAGLRRIKGSFAGDLLLKNGLLDVEAKINSLVNEKLEVYKGKVSGNLKNLNIGVGSAKFLDNILEAVNLKKKVTK